jgi:Arc/MetJ-type ribon-helix-helix transcriptional regulator
MKVINLRIPDQTHLDLSAEVMSKNYKNRVDGTGLITTKSNIIRVALEEWLNKNSKVRQDRREWMEKMASNTDNFPSVDTDDQPPDDAETEE